MKKRVCFFATGILPVPAVEGGAVENLIQSILDKNEEHNQLAITVLSLYSVKAETAARKYNAANFYFIKPRLFITCIDKMLFFMAKQLLKVKQPFSYRYIAQRLYFIYRYRNYFLKNEFDFIIAENHHTLFLMLKNKKLRNKIQHKLFYHAHCIPNGDFHCRDEIYNCPCYIVVSNFIAGQYRKRYTGIQSRFVTLLNAVDTHRFSQTLGQEEYLEERGKYRLDSGDKVILFAGRIAEQKGILNLAEAFTRISNPRVKLLIAGSSFYGTDVKDIFVDTLKKTLESCMDRVIFTGYIQYEEIWKLYKIADIGCFPSIWDEPAGMTCIEAMVSGLPIITTNVGGIPEYVTPECGFMLNADDKLTDAIRDTIEKLVSNEQLRRDMSEAGKKIGSRYNLERYYTDFLKIVES